MIGTSIGPYQILAELGKGGMGEVFRARDTALGRDVALKLLPRAFATDADRLARFEREAQALASLNHPNIAQVYAIERVPAGQNPNDPADSGAPSRAIVMELVEGEDLSQRLARGPIPLDDALPIARQIAFALEAAHEAGIIHRDLKPANIKIRPDGTAKVLDFGLAKALGADGSGSQGPGLQSNSLANSPTLTAAAFGAPGTEMGVILGTAAYMSPEQAKGRIVDRRADVWAFGVVLYEMLTGRRAFGGDDVTEVMAAVIRDTPDQAALPAGTPPAVRRLISRCLEKDVKKRLRDMGDAGVELDEAMSGATHGAPGLIGGAPGLQPRGSASSRLLFASLAVLLAALAAAAAWSLKPAPAIDKPIVRFALTLEQGQRLANLNSSNIAVSGDGRRIAYRADGIIFVRDLDDLKTREVVKAQGNSQWLSADGNTLLYRTTTGLSKMPVGGGPSRELLRLTTFFGLDWVDDGTIVYSDGKTISRIPEDGGVSTPIVTAAEGQVIGAPQMLPGGRAILYSISASSGGGIVVKGIDGEPASPKTLVQSPAIVARYVETGHLVYALDNRLMIAPFDLNRLEVIGTAVPAPESIFVSVQGLPQAALSKTGALAYIPGDLTQALRLSWIDGAQPARQAIPPLRNFSDLMLSRDGRRAALHLWDEDNDIWVADLVRGGLTRITFSKEEEESPVWSPDDRELAYAANRSGKRALIIKPADGSASAVERIVWQDPDHFHVNGWSPDGTILVEIRRVATANDIVAVDPKTGTSKPLLASTFAEYNARLSPDGKWMAYVSEESGRAEVYVQPYPALNARVGVSTSGGREPVWSHDGRTLYFRSAENGMRASFTSRSPLEFGTPTVAFRDTFTRTQGSFHTHFDVDPAGRFLIIENPTASSIGRQEIHVVLNWFEQVRKVK